MRPPNFLQPLPAPVPVPVDPAAARRPAAMSFCLRVRIARPQRRMGDGPTAFAFSRKMSSALRGSVGLSDIRYSNFIV